MKAFTALYLVLLCAYLSNAQSSQRMYADFENPQDSMALLHFGSELEGILSHPEPNPLKDHINDSDHVMPLLRGADAEIWAGAIMVPDMSSPLDATYVRRICMKVLYEAEGNLALKLEYDPFDDPENWINVMEVMEVGRWTEICFDMDLPSLEGNNSKPYGKIYDRLVFYPDFGSPGSGVPKKYFIDDIRFEMDSSGIRKNVAFSINMNTYSGLYDEVYVSGNFNGWSGIATPLSDTDGDGIYTGEAVIASGDLEYKYSVDIWSDQEYFLPYGECSKTTGENGQSLYVNRYADIKTDTLLLSDSWGSCYDRGMGVALTFLLNMEQENVDPEGVYLAGGCCFDHGVIKMTDYDRDDVYEVTIERERGFEGNYTFTNGLCPDNWECKEDLSDQDCADTAHYDDRYLASVMDDQTIVACFGSCDENGECLPSVMPSIQLTFQVDMSNEEVSPEGVYFHAAHLNWEPLKMNLVDDEAIYGITLPVASGDVYWRFSNGLDGDEQFVPGSLCSMSSDFGSGMEVFRFVEVDESMDSSSLNSTCFGSCDDCQEGDILSSIEDASQQSLVNISYLHDTKELMISSPERGELQVYMYTIDGMHVDAAQVQMTGTNDVRLQYSDLYPGVYVVALREEGLGIIKTERIVVW